jgi:nucleoside-diphosphate-sugar epimerase
VPTPDRQRNPDRRAPENRPADVIWFVTDNRPTTARLGWAPTRTAADVLRDVRDWLRERPEMLAALNP